MPDERKPADRQDPTRRSLKVVGTPELLRDPVCGMIGARRCAPANHIRGPNVRLLQPALPGALHTRSARVPEREAKSATQQTGGRPGAPSDCVCDLVGDLAGDLAGMTDAASVDNPELVNMKGRL